MFISAFVILLAPELAGTVLLSWIAAVLSPLLSLLLLLAIPMLFMSAGVNPATIAMILGVSVILAVLAVIPVPVLLRLKRWVDPPLAAPAEEAGVEKPP
jgi:hypothetical protein